MAFDIDKTLGGMKDAALGILTGEFQGVKQCIEKALREEKEALKAIAEARIKGIQGKEDGITDEEMQEQLEDEKETLEAALLACQVQAKAAVQQAVNAALKVFTDAVKAIV